MKLDFNTIIIGAGVAGMTSAIYLRRAEVTCLLIEQEMPGGQITRTSTIENYPGIKSITGPDLAVDMFSQVQELGANVIFTKVEKIIDQEEYKIIHTSTKDYTCKHVIIATGRSPRKLMIEGEEKYTNRGISYCAICDGPLYKKKEVAVIGGGNSAVEEAIYLSNICAHVTLIHRKDRLTAQKNLINRLLERPNVTIEYHSTATEFMGEDGHLTTIKIHNTETKKEKQIAISGCFIYIGQIPNTAFLKDLNICNEHGYVKTNHLQETPIDNIFAVGDVTSKELYQIVTATSDGAIAANAIINRQ